MKSLLILLIRSYQKTLSPDHGILRWHWPYGYCRFVPTCSEYALLVIQKRGSIRGVWATIRRLVRCHPWNPGGVDYP